MRCIRLFLFLALLVLGVVGCTRPRTEPLPPPGASSESRGVVVAGPISDPRARPPIVVVTVDTWRRDRLGVHGAAFPSTPVLRSWVDAGEVSLLEQGRSDASWTYPSIASLMTGLPPSAHGGVAHDHFLPQTVVTMAEALADRGYRTGFFGANFVFEWRFGLDQGFQHYFADAEQPAHALIQRAEEWLSGEGQEQPTFLHLHFLEPHCPYAAPPDLQQDWTRRFSTRHYPQAGRYDDVTFQKLGGCFDLHRDGEESGPELRDIRAYHRAYDAEVFGLDHALGQLRAMLERSGVWDSAMLVVVGDHGEEFLDHGSFGHGQTLYEEQVAVPMAVKLPGGARGGLRFSEPVLLSDWYPTVLGLAGSAPPAMIPSRDLLPWLLGQAPLAERPIDLETSYEGELRAVVSGPWKLVVDIQAGTHRLFHLERDPAEREDLAQEHPAVAADLMRQRLQRDRENRLLGIELGAVAVPLSDDATQRLQSLGYLR